MKDSPLVSVIVPVYNAERYLDRCIDSITRQTYSNLEIILVEDGSPDSCARICDKWAETDARVRVIHKENGGVSSARNAGLDIAAGEYITFADNDDILDADMIEFLYGNLIKYDADISRCSYRFYYTQEELYEDSEVNDSVVVLDNQEELLTDLYQFGFKSGVLWNRLYKRSVIESVRLNPALKSGGEDILFNYYALKNCKRMVCHDLPKYTYVMHSKNGIGGINFNYYMYLAMLEIIADKDAPLCMYHKFYVFAYMTLHDIVARGLNIDFCEVRQQILNHKEQILKTEQVSKDLKSKLRLYLLWLAPGIYKKLLRR